MVEKNKEIKVVIEKVVDKILTQKKNEKLEENKRKLEEQKRINEENEKLNNFKISLHSVLSPIKWDTMTIKEAKELVSKLEKWITENK